MHLHLKLNLPSYLQTKIIVELIFDERNNSRGMYHRPDVGYSINSIKPGNAINLLLFFYIQIKTVPFEMETLSSISLHTYDKVFRLWLKIYDFIKKITK